MKKLIFTVLVLLLITPFVNSLTVDSVSIDAIYPGQTGSVRIVLENNLDVNVNEVSLRLNFAQTPFIPEGSSENGISEISEDDSENFNFIIKSSNDIAPGDYEIPYILSYVKDDVLRTPVQITGSVGVRVRGNPDLVYSVSTENPVIGQRGQIKLKIVNKGFLDARFTYFKIKPSGFELLSEEEVYIGSIDSDDFETINFDVIFQSSNPLLIGTLEYKDFDNKNVVQNINLPVQIYDRETAKKIGLTKTNNFSTILITIVLIVVLWVLIRKIRKQRRLKRATQK